MTKETKTENLKKGRKPDWRLIQEKAFYKTERDGRMVRQTKLIEVTAGWNELSQEEKPYISFADSHVFVTPDIDGRVKLVLFQTE